MPNPLKILKVRQPETTLPYKRPYTRTRVCAHKGNYPATMSQVVSPASVDPIASGACFDPDRQGFPSKPDRQAFLSKPVSHRLLASPVSQAALCRIGASVRSYHLFDPIASSDGVPLGRMVLCEALRVPNNRTFQIFEL